MSLIDIISPSTISVDLTSRGKMDVLAEMSSLLTHSCEALTVENVTKILVDRERLATTGVGEGVAIPHGKSDDIKSIKAAVGVSRTGIPFDAVDGAPVHIFVALLAPSGSSGDHLKALARVSRLLKNPDFRARLLEARTPETALEVIQKEDEKY